MCPQHLDAQIRPLPTQVTAEAFAVACLAIAWVPGVAIWPQGGGHHPCPLHAEEAFPRNDSQRSYSALHQPKTRRWLKWLVLSVNRS